MGCIALVWCVLVLRCGLAVVVWYPYAGWGTLLRMDVLTYETCWALNNEIIKQLTSSWSLFIQLSFSSTFYRSFASSPCFLNAFLALPSTPFILLISSSSFTFLLLLVVAFGSVFLPSLFPCFACSQSPFFPPRRTVQVVAKVLESASVASAPSLAGGLQTPWRRSTFQASHRPRSVQSVSCSDLLLIFAWDHFVMCSKRI